MRLNLFGQTLVPRASEEDLGQAQTEHTEGSHMSTRRRMPPFVLKDNMRRTNANRASCGPDFLMHAAGGQRASFHLPLSIAKPMAVVVDEELTTPAAPGRCSFLMMLSVAR